jgi:hypothetical protein
MKISQREARASKRRVKELEEQLASQRKRWGRAYPGGINVAYWAPGKGYIYGILRGVHMTGHAIVAVPDNEGRIEFFALPQP